MSELEAREIIETIRREVEQAADMMLSAAEKGLRDLGDARSGRAAAFDSVERTLCAILEACAFQDLTGQRLSRLEIMIGASPPTAVMDPLLNGPAPLGEGLDQAAADAIIAHASS
jgi:hypothetical protein